MRSLINEELRVWVDDVYDTNFDSIEPFIAGLMIGQFDKLIIEGDGIPD